MNKTLKLMCATLLTVSFCNDAFAMKRSALAVQEKPINPPLVSPISILVPEIYPQIFSNLDDRKDVDKVTIVCKEWQKIIDEDTRVLKLRFEQETAGHCMMTHARLLEEFPVYDSRNDIDVSWLNIQVPVIQVTDVFTGALVRLSPPETIQIPSSPFFYKNINSTPFFSNNNILWGWIVSVARVKHPSTGASLNVSDRSCGNEILHNGTPFFKVSTRLSLESLSKRFPNVQELKGDLTNEILKYFTNITDLNLEGNRKVTDDVLKKLTKLKKLSLYDNYKITDASVSLLTNLESLNLDSNENISDDALKNLTKLKHLNLWENDKITSESLCFLKELTKNASSQFKPIVL